MRATRLLAAAARARKTVVADDAAGAVPQSKSYAVAGGLFVALVGVASYTFVYLPHYSPEALENRERTAQRRAAAAVEAARASAGLGGQAPGAASPGAGPGVAPAPAAAASAAAAAAPAVPPAVPPAMPFTTALAKDNAPGGMWRAIASTREIKEAAGGDGGGGKR
jgi:hypothetical protein